MAIDDRARRRLGEVLTEHLGDEGCELLMAQLPPQGWDELATKTDLSLMEARLLREVGSARTELKDEVGGLRTQLGTTRTELKDEIGSLRTDLTTTRAGLEREIGAVRTELKDGIAEVRLESAAVRTELWRATLAAVASMAALLSVFEFVLR